MSRVYTLLTLGLLLLTACTTTGPVRPDQLSFSELEYDFPTVEQYRLKNGMRLYLLPDDELPLIELSVVVGGGSVQDDPQKTGLSSLFAALLETGGAGDRSPQQLEQDLERMAAELSVGRDAYATTISMSLHSRDLERGLSLLADLLRRPRFDVDRLEIARNQIKENIRRQNDEPGAIAGRALAKAVYGEHPFGRHATSEKIDRIERSDLVRTHQLYFQPTNMWLSASGDIDAETLLEKLNHLFGDWQSSQVPGLNPPALPDPPSTKTLFVEKDLPQSTILMGHRGIEKNNPDMFALRVANYILGGGGFNSRMMREIRSNRGLAYSAYSYFQIGRILPEMFIASSETKCASTIEVADLMLELIRQLRNESVSQEELSLAKESLINSFVFAFDSSQAVVSRRVRLDYYDYPADYLETYREKIAAVTVEDVQRVAQKYLLPDQMQIILVGRSADFDQDPAALGCPVEQIDLDALD